MNIHIFKGDIGIETIFDKFENVLKFMVPVDGIFSLSMVLNDSLFVNMTQEQWDTTVASKINAIKRLDEYSRENPVTYFVSWSSISAGFGNIGQTNYAYGNSFCDRLVEKRNDDKLSGISIQWGKIGDVGFTSRVDDIFYYKVLAQPIRMCLKTIGYLLSNGMSGVYTNYIIKKKKTNKTSDTGKSLIDITCDLLGMEYKTDLDEIMLSELGIDSLLSTYLQDILKKKNIKCTLDEISKLTLKNLMEFEKNIYVLEDL